MRAAAVLLDFDGLIVDTESPIYDEWRRVFRERGHALGLDVWQHALGTHGAFDPCAHLAELTGEVFDHEALRAEVRALNWSRCEAQPLLPGVLDLLQDTRRLGLRAAVASSSSSQWVERWLERHGIRTLLDAVCTRDDVTRVKPAPDLYYLAARRLSVPPSACVVFEDSPNGVRAARAAGMRSVGVPNPVTCTLALEADLILTSLAERPLERILADLDGGVEA